MKKAIIALISFVSVATICSCKKGNETNSNNKSQHFTPPAIAPSQPGILQVSQTFVTIHVGQNVSVGVTVFHSDGRLQSPQPSLSWSVDKSNIAIVSSGTIHGVAIGSALVSVTDGTHGIEYVSVTVLSDTSTISNSATNISFNPPVLSLPQQASGSFSYTIKNQSGQTVSIMPIFVPSGEGITISNNTVHTGSRTGFFRVYAVVNGDTLSGKLIVFVQPQTYAANDSFYTWDFPTYPVSFRKKNITSLPILADITMAYAGGIQHFQTSPEQIVVSDPDIVTMASNGGLSSVNIGDAEVSFKYRTQIITFTCEVSFDFVGIWNGCVDYGYADNSVPMTTQYFQFTINSYFDDIQYSYSGGNYFALTWAYQTPNTYKTWGSTYNPKCSGHISAYTLPANLNKIAAKGDEVGYTTSGPLCSGFGINGPYGIMGEGSNGWFYIDDNNVELKSSSNYPLFGRPVHLVRGAPSNCISTASLEQTLTNNPSKLWNPNRCITDTVGYYITKFNTDHTFQFINPGTWTYSNTTWSTAAHDSLLILNWSGINAGNHLVGIDTMLVNYFTQDSIRIQGFSSKENRGEQFIFNCPAYLIRQ